MSERSFRIDLQGQQASDLFIRRLRQINGVKEADIDTEELIELSSQLLSSDVLQDSDHIRKYLGNINEIPDNLVAERIIQFLIASESFADAPLRKLTYGATAGEYVRMLSEQRTERVEDEMYSSLLLGAVCTTTTREYAATVRSVFPGAACMVVDIDDAVGKNDPGFIEFTQANAFNLPFEDETFDSVQTNFLLGFLTGGGEHQTKSQQRTQLFAEAHRVLRKNGRIMLIEWSDAIEYANSHHRMNAEMQIAGFRNVNIDSGSHFTSIKSIDEYYLGSESEIDENKLGPIEPNMLVANGTRIF